MFVPKTAQFWPPDYVEVYAWRQKQLTAIRLNPSLLIGANEYYKTHPVEFINHWLVTYDPRIAGSSLPAKLPFIMFKRQEEFVTFLWSMLTNEANGLVEKARDMGATWLCCAFSVWLWKYWDGASVGWGSRKEDLVDQIGNADSIFEKIRILIRNLPPEFHPKGFKEKDHMTFMRVINPENGSSITGESGDNIGRGGRKLIYFKDESAHYERPEKIEAALADNTRVQIDISSVHGLGNVFHRRREAGVDWTPGSQVVKNRANVFVMDWRDHPAKDQAWYDGRREKAREEGLLHVFSQEVDRNYSASIENVVIDAEWVSAAIDAHVKLNLTDDGGWCAGLDVADGGGDRNALAKRKGIVLKSCVEWGERDVGVTTRRAVSECEGIGPIDLNYDSIGVGAGVKSEANRLRDELLIPRHVRLVPWNAGAGVLSPEDHIIRGDKNSPINSDFYKNLKAQAWWQLRRRFERTFRALNEPGFTWKASELISLSSDIPLIRKIQKELSQATFSTDPKMKLLIDKAPDGTMSPNLADSIVMAFWPVQAHSFLNVSDKMIRRSALVRR
jgi:phage terminase large subunit